MLEEVAASYLEKYLGDYIKGLSKEALKISVWQGNVELTNMQLKPEALNALKLPIKVKAGFLGSVKLKVPWSRLGQEPVVVYLDRIFLLVEPATNVEGSDDEAVQKAKTQQVKEAETKYVEAMRHENEKQTESNNSWIESLIGTIIGNLKLSITNIHIRYEDTESNPGHPFAAGMTLEKLAAVTVDENGKEIFVTGGKLDHVQKSGELQRLAFYFDPDTPPLERKKPWHELLPREWSEIFEPDIKSEAPPSSKKGSSPLSRWKVNHQYLLQPVGGTALYYKLGNKDTKSSDKPAQKAEITLDDVTLNLSETQYRDALKLVENIAAFNKRVQYAHYRPTVTVKEDKKAWWKYVFKAVVEQQKRSRGLLSWPDVLRFARLRKQYLSAYIACLQTHPHLISCNGNREIQELDRQLESDTITQWRILAHRYVDSTRALDANPQRQIKKSWWLFGWGVDSNDGEEAVRGLNDEEWKQLNKVIGYTEGMRPTFLRGHDPPNMLHTVLEVRMRHNATRLLGVGAEYLMELSADGLACCVKLYPETKIVGVKLESYEVRSPEGVIAESNTQSNALDANLIYKPMDENVDWSLTLTASPCYVTFLKESFDNVAAFFQNSQGVSSSVARRTAAALQMTLDEVARNAHLQLNEALKDRPRFSLDLNIAAPKVTIPANFYPDGKRQTKLLLDFGYLTLCTDPESNNTAVKSGEDNLYMRFRINLSDVSAFIVDGVYDWGCSNGERWDGQSKGSGTFLPVLEKCGMAVAFQQICVPHPQYPSTRIDVRLPSLSFQISPARYHRLMQVLNAFQSAAPEDGAYLTRPWEPADFEGYMSALAWKGVGHREAVWQHRYSALAAPFLYLLKSQSAKSYEVCYSLIGKQVFPVTAEDVGGIEHVLAICDAGQFNKKVVESANALLLRFDDDETFNTWQSRLKSAIFQSSAPAGVAAMAAGEKGQDSKNAVLAGTGGNSQVTLAEQERFRLTGALDELRIVISNSQGPDYSSRDLLLKKEAPVVVFRALGSKVKFVMREYDMTLGAVLQSLELEDKIFGGSHPSLQYLARSCITSPRKTMSQKRKWSTNPKIGSGRWGQKHVREKQSEDDERFFDAEEDLFESDSDGQEDLSKWSSQGTSNRHFDMNVFRDEKSGVQDQPTFDYIPDLLPDLNHGNNRKAMAAASAESFIMAQMIFCSRDSPQYHNIDKEVQMSLTTLSFFCNRPTLLAMLDVVSALSAEIAIDPLSGHQVEADSNTVVTSMDPLVTNKSGEPCYDRNDSIVKGLLGKGKERVVFSLVLHLDRAQIVLNLEDGSQLATLSQDDLHTMVKIFPASYAIKAELGNLRINDDSLTDDHPYAYICDMRDPNGTSFIELAFTSFNVDDDDYEGYEYSLEGKLSEVRIVYLNRFIKELYTYFMGLVPQNAGYVVKLKDTVTNVEKLFYQSEIEGSPALKLDVALNKPIIIMPRATHSHDFLELDILHVIVKNEFQWLGGTKDDQGAVRLETMSLHVDDVHLVVGVDGKTGDGIIQESNGLSLILRRALRDLWRQIPAIEMTIKMDQLKAALSDKEYQVISECLVTNMEEVPNLPPPVAERKLEDDEMHKVIEIEDDRPEAEEQYSQSLPGNGGAEEVVWTTIKVTLGIELVELALYTGVTRDAALASVQVSGVWAAYKSTSANETSIMATLERFSVKDDREGTKPELRYMIGSVNRRGGNAGESNNLQHAEEILKTEHGHSLTMLVLDARLSKNLKAVSLRIQQPQLLVALDFLSALAVFFIPSIHAGGNDGRCPEENLLDMKDGIFLTHSVYKQSANVVSLSPQKPLVADSYSIDDYVYDGGGGHIRLLNFKGKYVDQNSEDILIFVGDCKKLQFKNVIFENGRHLDSCICLGSNSSYSACEHDGVFLEGRRGSSIDDSSTEEIGFEGNLARMEDPSVDEIMLDLQAIGPELTFYDNANYVSDQTLSENLLHVRMNMFSRFMLKGDDMELSAKISSLNVEASSGVNVLEPFDTTLKYSKKSGKANIQVSMSEIFTNFTFSVIQLILRLQQDVMSFLRSTSEQITVECSEFDKVWANEGTGQGVNQIAFWRPRAPSGFAVLGDCFTALNEPPSKGVIALNMGYSCVKRPVDFELLWSSKSNLYGGHGRGSEEECCVWLPVPPPGYLPLGCVASTGHEPPPLSVVHCVLAVLLSPCSMKDCVYLPPSCSPEEPTNFENQAFWRVDNSVGSFFTHHSLASLDNIKPYELRQVIFNYGFSPGQASPALLASQPPLSRTGQRVQALPAPCSGRIFDHVARFKLIWWNKDSGSTKTVSIWRPIPLEGYATLGDMAVEGYEPPSLGLVLSNSIDGRFLRKPAHFRRQGQIPRRRGLEAVSFWFPVAPPGYAALGCIATKSSFPQVEDTETIMCVRIDKVIGVPLPASSLWDSGDLKHIKPEFSIWSLQSEGYTFLVQHGLKRPPKRMALGLLDLRQAEAPDNLVIGVQAKSISASFFDDFGGLMAPLLDFFLSGITLTLHGRSEAFSSTANFTLRASTYNGKFDAWEPLVEECDGFVRYEYNEGSLDATRPTESHIRLAASTMLNVNLTTANINLFLEAAASWKKLSAIHEISKKQNYIDHNSLTRNVQPALDVQHEKSLVIVSHNELGEDIFFHVVKDDGQQKVLSVPSGGTVSVKLSTKNMEARRPKKPLVVFDAFRIGDAELPEEKSFGGREYMAAVRIVSGPQSTDQYQVQSQSARTRSKSPEKRKFEKMLVRWDEIFVFEIEPSETSTAEILVVDLAKGAAVGFCSIPLTEVVEREQSVVHRFKENEPMAWSSMEMAWHPLYTPQGLQGNDQELKICGKISISQYYFVVGDNGSGKGQIAGPKQGLLQVGFSHEGPWTNVGLNYALGRAPLSIGDKTVASEIVLDGRAKHLHIRSLVVVQNSADFCIEVSLFPKPVVSKPMSCSDCFESMDRKAMDEELVVEEIFENQRYQPISGWGSTCSEHLLPTDPGHWSNRDLSNSSQEFPDRDLLPNWEWTSSWYVDKVDPVDEEGWGYAFDFKNFPWPPYHSSEGVVSFVRRRRWVRTRKYVSPGQAGRLSLQVLEPGQSTPLPVAALDREGPDFCLQFRPGVEADGIQCVYGWSQVMHYRWGLGVGKNQSPVDGLHVRSLVETEDLLSCPIEAGNSSAHGKGTWLCVEVTSTVIGRDANLDPIKDWKIVLSAPLVLVNLLPVSSRFLVAEKSHEGRPIIRDQGDIKSGQRARIYNVDPRKALYLTWEPQGGWQPNREAVLISHPYRELERHISLNNSSTGRKLKVLIEYDEGVAAKVVRLFVPCWLDMDNLPSLVYRFVEIPQPSDHGKTDNPMTIHPSEGLHAMSYEGIKDGHVLEEIDTQDSPHSPVMLSSFDPKITGLSVALSSSRQFGPVWPLHALADVDGSAEVTAIVEEGSCFRMLVSTTSCPLNFAHTRVIRIRPFITFTNILGEALYLKIGGADEFKALQASDWRVAFSVPYCGEQEKMQVRLEGCEWSHPFLIRKEENMHVPTHTQQGRKRSIRTEIRSQEEGSRFSVVFRLGSTRGPYRIENRTTSKSIKYRQAVTDSEVDSDGDGWQVVRPCSTQTFAWEKPQEEQVLEVGLDGQDVTPIQRYEINTVGDHPILYTERTTSIEICVAVMEHGELKVVRFYESEVPLGRVLRQPWTKQAAAASGGLDLSGGIGNSNSISTTQLEVVLDIGKFGLSVVDQSPHEILFLFLENVVISYLTGFRDRTSRLKLILGYLQLDNQLPLTPMPVILYPERREHSSEFVLKLTIDKCNNNVEDVEVYQYVALGITESPWRINIHEPIIWAVMGMYNSLHLDRLIGNSEVVQVDPEIRFELFDISESRLKLSIETTPGQRPRGALGIYGPLVTTLGNTNKMPIRISKVFRQQRYVRKSQVFQTIVGRIGRDLMHQPLQLLSGVNVLGMTSSTLWTLSKGAAVLSNDERFLKLRMQQERAKNIANITDGLVQGTEALARGFVYGVAGVITKPITSARENGVTGFFQGIGKAAVGFVMQPVSGLLDFVALTVNGVGATCSRCSGILEQEAPVRRVRNCHAIRGDGVLTPYDENSALGQAILQMAESGYFRQKVFKEQAKFAWSDVYQEHFILPRNRIVMVTNRRVLMLLRPPSHESGLEKVLSDPCKIVWDVPWKDLLALEVPRTAQLSSHVILHRRYDPRRYAQLIKCSDEARDIPQADEVCTAIEQAWHAYRPDRRKLTSQMGMGRKHLKQFMAPVRLKLPAAETTFRVQIDNDSLRSDSLSSELQGVPRDLQRQASESSDKFARGVVVFQRIWTSELDAGVSCSLCNRKANADRNVCTLWRPTPPEGYVSVGDVAYIGRHYPTVTMVYRNEGNQFVQPIGYDLVWRNWRDGFVEPISIWMPRPPEGYVALGCVAVNAYLEPDLNAAHCARLDLVEDAEFEDRLIWRAQQPWRCYLYPILSDALTFCALREPKTESTRKPKRVVSSIADL